MKQTKYSITYTLCLFWFANEVTKSVTNPQIMNEQQPTNATINWASLHQKQTFEPLLLRNEWKTAYVYLKEKILTKKKKLPLWVQTVSNGYIGMYGYCYWRNAYNQLSSIGLYSNPSRNIEIQNCWMMRIRKKKQA